MQTLIANRPISVVMVTSGGSSYPTTGGDSTGSLDGSTFYTKVRGDGTTTIIRLKVTGGVIQEFGNQWCNWYAKCWSRIFICKCGYLVQTF